MNRTFLISGLSVLVLAGGVVAADQIKERMGRGHGMHFEQMDTNGDGMITVQEAMAKAQERFAESDANGDGLLSVEEITEHAKERAGKRAEKHAMRMMTWQDANGDGKLSFEEMGGSMHLRMMAHADQDGDGAISKEEIEQMMQHSDRGHMRGQHMGNHEGGMHKMHTGGHGMGHDHADHEN